MMTVSFDTLRYAKKLRAAGLPEPVAEAHAEALGEAVRDSLVTKADLTEGLEKLRSDLLRWIIPILIGQTAFFAAIVKLL